MNTNSYKIHLKLIIIIILIIVVVIVIIVTTRILLPILSLTLLIIILVIIILATTTMISTYLSPISHTTARLSLPALTPLKLSPPHPATHASTVTDTPAIVVIGGRRITRNPTDHIHIHTPAPTANNRPTA